MKNVLLVVLLSTIMIACNSSGKKKNSENIVGQNTVTNQDTTLVKSMERGSIIYEDFCLQCHMANGNGVPDTFPPLAKSNWLTEKTTESIHAIKFGQQGKIEVNGEMYNGMMAPMGLSDEEIADVMNYIMNSWGNSQSEIVTAEEVSKVLKD